MNAPNKFGLKRHIPAAIEREIRRRCKFGCVVCRKAIYDYEHIIPEFKNAKEHNPDNICLLCGSCHSKVTRGQLSKESIRKYYNRVMQDDNIKQPFEEFDLTQDNVDIILGSAILKYSDSILEINGESILKISAPEKGSFSPRLNGIFHDDLKGDILKIENNVWSVPNSKFDIQTIGQKIIINNLVSKKTILEIKVSPPNQIHFVYLDIVFNNVRLLFNKNQFIIQKMFGDYKFCLCFSNIELLGGGISIIESDIFDPYRSHELVAKGDVGIEFPSTGIILGKGAGSMLLKDCIISTSTEDWLMITRQFDEPNLTPKYFISNQYR